MLSNTDTDVQQLKHSAQGCGNDTAPDTELFFS